MGEEKSPKVISAQIEGLAGRIEAISDPAVKANATVLIQSLLDLHAAGFERVTTILDGEGEAGRRILRRLASDELVGSLLLLYELHPDGFEARLQQGIARAREAVAPQGASLELIEVNEGAVHIRVHATGQRCGSTKATIEQLVENSIYESVPEVAAVKIERAMQNNRPEPLVQLQLAPQRG